MMTVTSKQVSQSCTEAHNVGTDTQEHFHTVTGKTESEYSRYNFDKFRHSFTIFDMNCP